MQRVKNSRGKERNSKQKPTDIWSCSNRTLLQELEETKQELETQKCLKEMHINREKRTRNELESLRKYSDAETLSTDRIASLVRDTAQQEKEEDLRVDYEELKVAYLVSQEKFTTERQHLQEEHQRCESELIFVRQQADTLRCELDKEVQEKLQETLKCSQETTAAELQEEREKKKLLQEDLDKEIQEKNILKRSQETTAAELQEEREKKKLLQEEFDKEVQEKNILKRSQETTDAELQEEREKKKLLQEELEEVKVSYNEQLLRCETDLDDIKQQAELQQEVAEVSNVQQLNNSLPNAPALESIQEEAEIFEEKLPATTPKTPSFCKRVRHFLGLRKPQRWKKKKEE